MAFLYELAILGDPTSTQIDELKQFILKAVQLFNLQLGKDVAWEILPAAFNPGQKSAAAAVFFGSQNVLQSNLTKLLQRDIPILPVVSNLANVHAEIPPMLQSLNCLAYNSNTNGEAQRIATALLECVGLLPRQRRVFLSYRRDEAEQAALQLFDAFSSRHFDVFLDTHGIAPAEDFQSVLWHRLCGSDVLVMLDTPKYFASRWTSAEFGRALAKGISVLRIGWPNTTPSPRAATAKNFSLQSSDFDPSTSKLDNGILDRICSYLEAVRSESYAIRYLNLVGDVQSAVEQVGGRVTGVGKNKAVYIQLANGMPIVIFPTLGIPESTNLHDAATNVSGQSVGVLYDHVGLHPDWVEHLDWLDKYIHSVARWIKATDAAWVFASW